MKADADMKCKRFSQPTYLLCYLCFSMVPGILASQLEILSMGQTCFEKCFSSYNSLHQHYLVVAHQYWLQFVAGDSLLVNASLNS